MNNIVYFDVRGHTLTYCKIFYSDRFLFLPTDKIDYGEIEFTSKEELAEYVSTQLIDEETVKIITDYKDIQFNNKEVSTLYKEYNVEDIPSMNLFNLYLMRFGTVRATKQEMIVALLKDLLSVILKACGLMVQIYNQDKKYKITTCWFTVTIDSFCKKLGTFDTEIDYESPYLYYDIEDFKRKLNQSMIATGVSVEMCKGVTLLNSTKEAIDNIFSKAGSEIPNYLVVENIRDKLLSLAKIDIKTNSSNKILARLYNTMQENTYSIKADYIVKMLENSGKKLKLEINDKGISFNVDSYRKDFSKDDVPKLSTRVADYGLIIDCEGTQDGGCRELGMLIICRMGDILINVKGYRCNESQIAETLDEMYKDYAEFIERYIPSSGIPCYVYGPNDRQRIINSLVGKKNKSSRKTFENRCKFIDCQAAIKKYVGQLDSYKLGDVASELGVAVVAPKHDPLNDCKTLFNILAKMLMLGEHLPEK